MNKTYILALIVIIFIVSAGVFYYLSNKSSNQGEPKVKNKSSVHSPYAGQETRGIKALSQDDVEGLLAGSGTPFGGMAKPAELNGYPGPRHTLDAIESGEFEVSDEQKKEIESLYEEMKSQAIALGEEIVELEQDIDTAFADRTINEEVLKEKIGKSASLYGDLRIVHLSHHFSMMDILSPEQVAKYNELRGYTSEGDPCENIPEGHDPEQWKMHNGCV